MCLSTLDLFVQDPLPKEAVAGYKTSMTGCSSAPFTFKPSTSLILLVTDISRLSLAGPLQTSYLGVHHILGSNLTLLSGARPLTLWTYNLENWPCSVSGAAREISGPSTNSYGKSLGGFVIRLEPFGSLNCIQQYVSLVTYRIIRCVEGDLCFPLYLRSRSYYREKQWKVLLMENTLDFLEKCPENFSVSIDWLRESCTYFRRFKWNRLRDAKFCISTLKRKVIFVS